MYYLISILFLLFLINFIFAKNLNLTIKKIRNTQKSTTSKIIIPLERSHADPCLLRCKDEYMFSNIKAINSQLNKLETFAIGSPLNSLIDLILSSKEDNTSPLEKIAEGCEKHNKFVSCLRPCQNSIARQILADGQQAMNAICQSFLIDKEFKLFVLPCLSKNGLRVGKSCQLHWSLMESDIYETISQNKNLFNDQLNEFDFKNDQNDGFQHLCRAMNSYADCHLKAVAKLCHRRTIPFFVRFNAKISAALLQMILDWFGNSSNLFETKWTEECEQWEPQKLLKSVFEEQKNNSNNLKFFKLFLLVLLFLFYKIN